MTSQYSQIPHQWFQYQNKFGRFITYWGDIYSGTLWKCPNYHEGFFIVPNFHLYDIANLSLEEKTPDKFRELGFEVMDYRVITKHYHTPEIHPKEFNTKQGPTISKSGQVFKDMFILGAGASAFCCFGDHKERYEHDPWRSPLGYDIFNERFEHLCQHYQGVKMAIPEFELRENTIEACLEEEWEKYSKAFMPEITFRHLNIQFYLQELFKKISNEIVSRYYRKNSYQILANRLLEKCSIDSNYRPVLVNFNYDTILDSFIEKVTGQNYNQVDEYIDWANRPFVHFKPHGSSNWGWKFPKKITDEFGKKTAKWLYENKITPDRLYYEILGEYQQMVNEYSYSYEKGTKKFGKHFLDKMQIQITKDEPSYPALLLPFKEKDEFVMPYHHQTALGFVMGDVERLFVIGWKGSEQLFLQQLEKANRIKEVIIVNPEFENVKANLERHIKSECKWIHVTDFESFIKQETI